MNCYINSLTRYKLYKILIIIDKERYIHILNLMIIDYFKGRFWFDIRESEIKLFGYLNVLINKFRDLR